ncbi:MAG: ATP synthase F1 subunit epsilon [Candidatus Auribacterota bacterium]|jgi:F-type H+-transporting ATPase subunit epsilon|uniref:ATP synthase epsilon chain n=1 Tax=Candidatus Auribacter fodinae TaxID=2093366 RepID=A0A3A4QZT5_9BACT|nr:MAG: ATP synthase F1 subunit epsilon [Candidatus Auribacter fodinae]
MNVLKLQIVTPEKEVSSVMCVQVVAHAEDGLITIQPSHARLATNLKISHLVVDTVEEGSHQTRSSYYAVSGGILFVENNLLRIMTPAAENGASIDAARAARAKKRAEERLNSPSGETDRNRAQQAYWRAQTRLAVAEFHKKGQ